MPPANRTGVSDAELEVLKALWKRGPGTVREVEARLREKGYGTQERAAEGAGAAHTFRAAVTRGQVLGEGLKELSDRICDGTASPLVHALVKDQMTKSEIAELRQMLDDMERNGGQ